MPAPFLPMFVGVDVSARWLDVALPSGDVIRVANPGGIPALLDRLPAGAIVGIEATSTYYRPVAYALHTRGFGVYVLNPLSVKRFAGSLLRRAKTDRADARLIARFVAERHSDLMPYEPTEEALVLVGLLVRLMDGLTSDRVGVLNRLQAWEYAVPGFSEVVRYVPMALEDLRGRVLQEALVVVRRDMVLSSWLDAITSLPGFGPVLALKVMGYSGDLRRFKSARAYAAFTGLTPRIVQSGDSLGVSRISRVGPSRLRGAFYVAAQIAYRYSVEHKAFVDEMLARGKPKKVALVALANRLARVVWSVCVRGLDKRGVGVLKARHGKAPRVWD